MCDDEGYVLESRRSENLTDMYYQLNQGRLSSSVGKAEVKSLVTILLSGLRVGLVLNLLLRRQLAPLLLLFLVQSDEPLALAKEDNNGERKD